MSFSIIWCYEEDGKTVFCSFEEYVRRFPPSFPRLEKLLSNPQYREELKKALDEKYGNS
jgi:hypothetical protein